MDGIFFYTLKWYTAVYFCLLPNVAAEWKWYSPASIEALSRVNFDFSCRRMKRCSETAEPFQTYSFCIHKYQEVCLVLDWRFTVTHNVCWTVALQTPLCPLRYFWLWRRSLSACWWNLFTVSAHFTTRWWHLSPVTAAGRALTWHFCVSFPCTASD